MKHYIMTALFLLIIILLFLLFNKNVVSAQQDPAKTTEREEPASQLADISKSLNAIHQRLRNLGDRVANLEQQQIKGEQEPVRDAKVMSLSTPAANTSNQEGVADTEMNMLAQATGVTATQLAAMNGSEIEILKEQQAVEQDKQYFKQLDQHFYADKSATFDKAFEQSLTDSVNLEELSNSKVSNISCDSAMCRLEVKHSDPDAMNKFLDKVPGLSSWNTEAIVDFPEGPDKPTSVIYLARKDHSLPKRSINPH